MANISQPDFRANRLLALIPDRDYRRLQPELEPVSLTYRLNLYAANRPIQFVYFLQSGVASLVNTMRNGNAAEVGTMGNEGMVGLPILLGDERAPTSAYIQVPGVGVRMRAESFQREFDRSALMRTIMLHYAHAFFNQVAQSAACNHFHSVDQRCCRWLLMTRERMPSDEFLLTHEFLAMMLGVRRAGVTEAMSRLKQAGIIRYSRGVVTILEHDALLGRSCECYAVSKSEFDRLLAGRPERAVAV
jgi:CRP-like cAMP-binding protein